MDNNLRYGDTGWPLTDAKEIIFEQIKEKSLVLDLGCWTGRFGEKLKKEKKCTVYGIEINKQAAKIASSRLDKVILADLDSRRTFSDLTGKKFDYICANDVLEHLIFPERLLTNLSKYLDKKGRLLVSIPNIAYWETRLNLLFGRFVYEKTGILDETHLRFYTQKSARQLLLESGYTIEKFYYTGRRFLPRMNAIQMIFVCKVTKT